MVKIAIKSEELSPFGGIFWVTSKTLCLIT